MRRANPSHGDGPANAKRPRRAAPRSQPGPSGGPRQDAVPRMVDAVSRNPCSVAEIDSRATGAVWSSVSRRSSVPMAGFFASPKDELALLQEVMRSRSDPVRLATYLPSSAPFGFAQFRHGAPGACQPATVVASAPSLLLEELGAESLDVDSLFSHPFNQLDCRVGPPPTSLALFPSANSSIGSSSSSGPAIAAYAPVRDALFPLLRVLRITCEPEGLSVASAQPPPPSSAPRGEAAAAEAQLAETMRVGLAAKLAAPTVVHVSLPFVPGGGTSVYSLPRLLEPFSERNCAGSRNAEAEPFKPPPVVLTISRLATGFEKPGIADLNAPRSLRHEQPPTFGGHYFSVRGHFAAKSAGARTVLGFPVSLPKANFVSLVNLDLRVQPFLATVGASGAVTSLRLWNCRWVRETSQGPDRPPLLQFADAPQTARAVLDAMRPVHGTLRALDLASAFSPSAGTLESPHPALDVLYFMVEAQARAFRDPAHAVPPLAGAEQPFPPALEAVRVTVPFNVGDGDSPLVLSFHLELIAAMLERLCNTIPAPEFDEDVCSRSDSVGAAHREWRYARSSREIQDKPVDVLFPELGRVVLTVANVVQFPPGEATDRYRAARARLRAAFLRVGFYDVRFAGLVPDLDYGPLKAEVFRGRYLEEGPPPGSVGDLTTDGAPLFPSQGTLCPCDVCQAYAVDALAECLKSVVS